MVMRNKIQEHKATYERGMVIVSCVMAFVILMNFYLSLSIVEEPNSYYRLFDAVIAVACFVLVCRTRPDSKNTQKYLILILGFWVFSVFSGLLNGAASIFRSVLLFDMIFNGCFAYIMVTKRVALFPIKVAFLIISLYFAYTLFIEGLETTEIFTYSAGGMIGTTLLSLAIAIQYLEYRENNRIPILPSVITLLLSTFSYSRASIVCALVYFLVVLFFSTRNINNRFFRYIPFIIIVGAIAYFLVKNWELIETLDMYEKFERKGVETDGRGDIWSAYIGSLDIGSFIFGKTLDQTHMIMGHDNPHNIIIRLHSQFGILAFMFYYKIILAFIRLLRKNPFISFLLFAMVLRGMFDIAYFFGDFDYIILAIIFEKQLKREKIAPLKLAII